MQFYAPAGNQGGVPPPAGARQNGLPAASGKAGERFARSILLAGGGRLFFAEGEEAMVVVGGVRIAEIKGQIGHQCPVRQVRRSVNMMSEADRWWKSDLRLARFAIAINDGKPN